MKNLKLGKGKVQAIRMYVLMNDLIDRFNLRPNDMEVLLRLGIIDGQRVKDLGNNNLICELSIVDDLDKLLTQREVMKRPVRKKVKVKKGKKRGRKSNLTVTELQWMKDAILRYLESHGTAQRGDLSRVANIKTQYNWRRVSKELLEEGKVATIGKRGNTTYQLVTQTREPSKTVPANSTVQTTWDPED